MTLDKISNRLNVSKLKELCNFMIAFTFFSQSWYLFNNCNSRIFHSFLAGHSKTSYLRFYSTIGGLFYFLSHFRRQCIILTNKSLKKNFKILFNVIFKSFPASLYTFTSEIVNIVFQRD